VESTKQLEDEIILNANVPSERFEDIEQVPWSGFEDKPPANLFEPLVIVTVVPGVPEFTLNTRSGLGSTVKDSV
jgi:hypothetical protein